jgi:CubicO group peptidase (beta-lactamase class C family)
MRTTLWNIVLLALAIGCTKTDPPRFQATRPVPSAPVFPGSHWASVPVPEAAGYSTAKLDMVRAFLADLDTTAAVVILHGQVLLQYGAVERVSYVASVRKSVLAMLFGEHVARGQIREGATLSELSIDDVGGLTLDEKRAKVDDLLTTRSGVYHAAANPGDDLKDAPLRGSKRPGEWFLYSNWDFNVLGTIFEQQAREDIYDALERELAQPVGMEDFRRSQQQKVRNDPVSIHPAYHMYLSTRDMARLGYLMLRGGFWNARELIPSSWVVELTTLTTHAEEAHGYENWGLGYGRLWWLFDDPKSRAGGPLHGAYTAIGAFGQYITVIPNLDLVIAHKVVHVANEDVSVPTYRHLVDLIVASRSEN